MIQWVASPLNQGYCLLTKMLGEGEMDGVRTPLTVVGEKDR